MADFIDFFYNWAYKVKKIEHVKKNAKNPKVDKVDKIDKFGLKVLVVHNSAALHIMVA